MNKPEVIIIRDSRTGAQCLGTCYVKINDVFVFKSEVIERGDNDNKARVSCVPQGHYVLMLEYSPRFKQDLWEAKGVPNRSECKFHAANYARQLNGCFALGENRADIDKDGQIDVTSSRKIMAKFHEALDGYTEAKLKIINL